MRRLILICFTILALDIHSTESKPAVFAVGPNIFRLDADETVLVVLSGINSQIQTSVYLQDYPKRQKTYAKQIIQLRQGHPEIKTMKVKSSEFSDLVTVEEGQPRYLYLVIESKDKKFTFKRESVILVQPSSGYVFIQTDKPIYSPRQTVNIRVIPVDQALKPTPLPINLELLNPQDVIVERNVFQYKDKFISHSHHVVERPMFGNWTLRAKYGKNNASETSIQFEVREYLLPKFEVTIETNKFILPQTKDLKGVVSARYFQGELVKGFVKMAISVELDGKVTKLGSINKNLVDGDMEFQTDLKTLLQPLGLDGFADGGRLLLDADVTERATMHTETKEDRTCVFVRSPYSLRLTRSSRYFKPSLTYDVRVDGKLANGQTAKNVEISINVKGRQDGKLINSETRGEISLDDFGRATVQFDVFDNINFLDISVETNNKEFPNDNQAKAVLTAQAYSSPSKSYIIVRSKADVGTVGQALDIEMIIPKNTDIAAMQMIVISRGKVVHSETLNKDGGLFNTKSLRITQEMVPSIRVIGYYIIQKGSNVEIVPDSLWIDIEDQCANEVTIVPNRFEYEPDADGRIVVSGEPGTLVGLSMVDAAVFLLNDRHLLTREKLFNTLNKFDLGCGPGGGSNSAGVFMDSGLSVVSTSNLISKPRDSAECKDEVKQRKRREAVANNKELHGRICCSEGMKVFNSSQCYDSARNLINASSKCQERFYQCCRRASLCREEPDKCFGVARAGGDGADELYDVFADIPVNIDDLVARTNFKESTLFEHLTIGSRGSTVVPMSLPSSITKWMIQALTVSPKSGFCVVNPTNVTVYKSLYIDVSLPFKAVRGEQLEVKVTVYNFQMIEAAVIVNMYGVSGLCSEAPPEKKSANRRFRIASKDAVATSFPVVPLEARTFKIKVAAFTALGGDLVEKELHVVAEGKRMTKSHSFALDPQGRLKDEDVQNRRKRSYQRKQSLEVDVTIPENIIKGSESCTASAIGSLMGHSVQTAITGVANLMRVPIGCGEQTVIRLAPTVYSTAYLSQTSPDLAGIEEKARKLIQQGYNRELKYRKADGSFAVWTTHPSSTWLTAFVLKVFCQAREFIDLDAHVIFSGLNWLKTHQTPEGIFKDPYKVHHQEMIGGVKEDVSLTAFVLITLRECHRGKQGLAPGESQAVAYLENKLENLQNLYTLAITTYALSLSNSQKKERANKRLQEKAVYSNVESTRHWPAGGANSALAVEATSYALLAQLELQDIGFSHAIVNWLTKKRSASGAFVSTQDTVVGLQAITKYSIETFSEDLDLNCDFTSTSDVKFKKTLSLKQTDALVQQTVNDMPVGGKLLVEAKGVGVGQLQIELGYNIPTEKDELCRFEMSINCSKYDFNAEPNKNCDVCGEECEEVEDDYYDGEDEFVLPDARSAQGGKDQMAHSPRRSRVGRQAARIGGQQNVPKKAPLHGASKEAVCINVCVSSLTGKDTGMSIIDVGLLTGFSAVINDLKKLKTDNIIDNYDLLEGRVILYVEKIPKRDPFGKPLCVKFRARQDNVVGNIQPASVKVYYYYEPNEVSCTQFYRPDELSGLYQKLCENDVCKCAEGFCPKCYNNEEKWALRKNDLMKIACTEADYVYRIKVTRLIEDKKAKGILQTKIKADLKKIINPGGDDEVADGDSLDFFIIQSCSCPVMEEGKDYLIMGKDGQIIRDQSMHYQLDDKAFVMRYYNKDDNYENRSNRRLGYYMDKMTKSLEEGCPL